LAAAYVAGEIAEQILALCTRLRLGRGCPSILG
jgi:hypothetical protein